MLIGIIEESNRKYLKKSIKTSPGVPTNPFITININESKTITKNSILLKKLSYSSSFPNLVPESFIFKDNFVYLPV